MKKIKLIFALIIITIFYSCGGSESYQGKWKALDLEGRKYEITFTENEIFIKDSFGKLRKHSYVQTSVSHLGSSNNFADTFEIRLNNGQKYQIFFPKDEQDSGLIRVGYDIYSISRKDYLTVDEIEKSE
ncbi:MAG: hypothetical protein CUR32_11055 [Flavobacterium sp.]|jgi:hypothetical protein|nr:MAG: hypothetical protein CUR32_11055 [Flavobacterium sp.] [Flavobacterium sp. FEMGT703F]